MASALHEQLAQRSVVICVGAGGVGKTSIAAALAIAAATEGRRCCVVTVDPARRLADALGLEGSANEPVVVAGPWPGRLEAVVLDARATFDALVGTYAPGDAQRERILSNRIYQSLTESLGGTQEYMAAEKLYELHASGNYDLIVVDTPPARAALDFLHAPTRLVSFFDNRVLKVLLAPGRASLRAVSIATRVLLRTIGRVAGGEVVDDTVAFFEAFEGMEAGFRARARHVEELLVDGSTGYVLVTTGRAHEAAEALHLGLALVELGHRVDALVANRDLGDLDDFEAPLAATGALGELGANLAELGRLARAEHEGVASLARELGGPVVSRVPLLAGDVHDLASLGEIAAFLTH